MNNNRWWADDELFNLKPIEIFNRLIFFPEKKRILKKKKLMEWVNEFFT